MKLKCWFCENKQEPDYQEFDMLPKFISDRGKIMSREKSGVCSRHQRRLAKAIKYDRHLALLPFVS
ncbi:30S ribosomal protein S18 [Candidatus Beckwithbacteria bacterium CG_4_10_14_0_2_um_filter_47_25]|uniref:30S ribosomal protein S18 n=4 Tax=Candidatus Beckwithiibacteriota TaxID=1752726 RepID=A0A1J4RM78_9BACT|nr:MAG: 30S ribosomal protein S18 [Candidatus Beckwithbacteria bacterium CG1_02_47_37]PIP52469.1 MAG: 30S ribosomal protein S18 [Candidatus Beckwithbacteria bacterium CG23_combo_of_CG06-09_8_20_14_all_47_9]PJA22161.1 MAG: 30S ribosomal protein S18 [Candidatus Beckwithbacteria bacterium CG_4_10_14_0_2_um_filter_47_25]PJC66401.1 MAG: 30S ribosomal protein S18 [Candidatus Beckwithbacteria bacterium CG_4_9_14_0_2_um_filter_47_11]